MKIIAHEQIQASARPLIIHLSLLDSRRVAAAHTAVATLSPTRSVRTSNLGDQRPTPD